MKLSETKVYNLSRFDKNISTAELLEKSGYIKQIQSGLYVQMNLMKRVINNIERIVMNELNDLGCLEIGLNQIQSADTWKETGRYDSYGSEMFKLKDRSNKEMIISGTNEELVTMVAKDYVKSYKDLSFTFYQINNKFRDEIRCSGGLFRCKEFSMMDAYSFHRNCEELAKYYENMRDCYIRIFDKLGLKYRIEKADSGEIGGSISEEFIVETSDGEIEIGHIFQLDTKYTSKLDATFIDNDNIKKDIYMGCYGIGITRLAQVLADIGRKGDCFNFAENISAFQYGVIVGNINNVEQMEAAKLIYDNIKNKGYSVYLDDRDLRIGQKLNEIDTIGTSNKILIGNNIKDGIYETKKLSNDTWVKTTLIKELV
jgi:prolyl-tRNA synthetase